MESVIDKVLRQINIVEIVSQYISLTKKGKNYVGICPFHEDSNPSLVVSPEKQIYNCFVCNNGGNAIAFIQRIEKCDFKEAFNKLIDLSGLDESFKMKVKEEITYNPYNELQQRQIKMNDAIQEFLKYNARMNSEGCLDYLKNRGINDESLDKFGIGYLSDINALTNYLIKKYGFQEHEMAENDFFRIGNYGIFSPYEHRITIPIYDRFHYLIGYAGRQSIVNTGLDAKYINPSTTEIFQKSQTLYNMFNANGALRNNDAIFVVEGYMDAITMDQNGYPNTVALMGTALTDEHITLLKHTKKDIVIVLDGDQAGQNAMLKIYRQCARSGLDVMFAVLPEGKDPDDMFKINGQEMKELLDNYQFGYEFAVKYYDKTDNFKKQKEQIKELMIDFSLQDRDALDKAHFFQLLSKKYEMELIAVNEVYMQYYQERNKVQRQNQYRKLSDMAKKQPIKGRKSGA